MKILKKVVTGLINAVSTLIIVVAVVMLVTVIMTRSGSTPSVFGFSFFRVLTGSMEPAIPIDSMVVVQKRDPETIREGDVITFYSSDPSLGGAVNTHRVSRVLKENGTLAFETKGDANYIPDKYETQAEDVIGVVIFSSYYLGKGLRLVSNPLIFLPLVLLPLLIMMITNLVQTARLSESVHHQRELEGQAQDETGEDEE